MSEKKSDIFKIRKQLGLPSDEKLLYNIRCVLSRKRKLDLHGNFYLWHNFAVFWASVFGAKAKVLLPLAQITSIDRKRVNDRKFSLILKDRTEEYTFIFKTADDEIFDGLKSAMMTSANNNFELESVSSFSSNSSFDSISSDDLAMSSDDWDIILKGAECISYRKGDVILSEGRLFAGLQQVGSGSVRIEKALNGKPIVLNRLHAGEIFGEIAFLEGAPYSATVIAEEDVDIYTLSGLNEVVNDDEVLTNFFKYIGATVAGRLRNTY